MSVIEIPQTLPVTHLSASSVEKYLKCPEKWRREYLMGERPPSAPRAYTGGRVHDAIATAFRCQLEDVHLTTAEILDAYATGFDANTDEPITWDEDSTPASEKDAGAHALTAYLTNIYPTITPYRVETPFQLRLWGEAEWDFVGRIDLETLDGVVVDYKISGKTADYAANLVQPSAYLLARQVEGDPAERFEYHHVRRPLKTKGAETSIIPAPRSQAQLDGFTTLVANVARDIAWRTEPDTWTGAAPGSWWCSERWCMFWQSCPYGGAS